MRRGARHLHGPRAAAASLLLLAALLAGCRGGAEEPGPELVVRQFVEAMGRAHGEPGPARAAYDLLWPEAQKNLAERAKRASALTGRAVAPEEMLAPSRFVPAFTPRRYTARVEGDWAIVDVIGDDPASEVRQVKCQRTDGAWRVVLELPPLPPIQSRPGPPPATEK